MHEVHPAWSVTEATLRNERLQTDGHTCGDWVIYKLIQEIGSIATFADGVDVARINLANIAQGEVDYQSPYGQARIRLLANQVDEKGIAFATTRARIASQRGLTQVAAAMTQVAKEGARSLRKWEVLT